MRSTRPLAITAIAAMTAVAALAAAPTADLATVDVDGDTISIAGTLGEDLGVISIGLDEVGDAVGSGAGVDMSEYAVSFPELGKVAFHVTLGDANPVTGYSPQGLAIEITPTIGETAMELTVTSTLDGGLEFSSQTCAIDETSGVNTCTATPAEGSYADGVLTWVIPTDASADTQINGVQAHSNYYIGTGVQGVGTLVNGIIDEMSINAFATIPSATLMIDGAAAGNAILSNAGYAVSASGIAAGEHAVSVQLCGGEYDFSTGGPANCTTVDLGTVTVS